MIGSDYKVTFTWVEKENPQKVLARTTLKFKKLFRGETQVRVTLTLPLTLTLALALTLTLG